MNFLNYFYESEDKESPEFNPEELEQGLKTEKEHGDLWEKFKTWADENKFELPTTEDEFYETIAKAHLREISDYYSRLKKMEEEAKKPTEEIKQ